MSKVVSHVICILIAVFVFNVPTTVYAKAKPVPGVMAMFDEFNELEEEIRAGEWDNAQKTISEIKSSYKKLVGQLKGTVDGKTIMKFVFFIDNLKKSIAKKNEDAIEKPYMTLQGFFLDIMDFYDYDSQPVLILIARYIGEAEEGLEKKDFKEAAEEMEEIGEFKARAEKAFQEKGASLSFVNEFFEKIQGAEKAAVAKNGEGAESLVKELKTMISVYVKVDDES